uniref:Uncharacterized protein n=1 Tax=Sipha flava TaxID=143950 RepID=A0A2S2QCK4_9HEMI
MDAMKDNEYIFNLKLSKLIGLYQILDPNTIQIFGYNVYHIGIVFVSLYMMAISLLSLIRFYYLINNINEYTFYLGCVLNYMFSCYKIIQIVYCSNDIWKCTDITSIRFLSYQYYDKSIFKNWQVRSIRLTKIYVSLSFIVTLFWLIISKSLSKNIFTSKNLDGSLSKYRMNIFNLYLIASDETYNRYFNLFYLIELIVGVAFMYFSTLFDVLMVMMCFSFLCQLETICDAMKSLGHQCSKNVLNICKEIKSEIRHADFDDLKAIINDHQNVMKAFLGTKLESLCCQ